MAEDGYEDLDDLKKELSGKKIEESTVSNAELFTAVKGLSAQIVQLTEIFKMAIGQMSQEDDIMKKVEDHLEQLIKNDQDLARGLLLVLEIEKDKRDYQIDKPLTLRRPLMRHRLRRGNRLNMGAPPPLPEGPSAEDLDVEFPSDASGQQGRPGQ